MFRVCPVLIPAMRLQIAKLRKLAQVTLGGSGIKPKVTDDGLRRNMLFIVHKY